jgi:hypothetical protein
MLTTLKFQIIPSQTLYPELPTIDLFVTIKVTKGWFSTSEVYTWSCLPGYSLENMGTVDVGDYTDFGHGYSFYLYSRPFDVDDPATNPCYGILYDIPKAFDIGSGGNGSFHYTGIKSKRLLEAMKGRSDFVPYADWKLLNVY